MNSGQAQDFEFALAIGSDHGGFVAYLFIQQRLADRRCSRNFSASHIGFFAGNELVFDLFILRAVVDLDGGTETNFVLGDVVHVGQREVGEALAELAEAGFDELLALLGHVVFGVLAEVAERGGALDFFGKLVDEFVLERVDFFLELLAELVGHLKSACGLDDPLEIINLVAGGKIGSGLEFAGFGEAEFAFGEGEGEEFLDLGFFAVAGHG